ncbi:MAG: HNH endonuclease [Deltaproteobacteria bacterium]|jgi:hypothetical protein|nr:HNH endonuclease [Deltaproteobacteria bacterium]
MRIKDIKILWGRSGNRCAICKIEVTPDGEIDTIGEIAHIVSRSPEGPRGDDNLPLEKRDEYSNLILLCPTHHSEIDTFIEKWPVSKIHEVKNNHEKWVSDRLEQGIISYEILNTQNTLLFSRKKEWGGALYGFLVAANNLKHTLIVEKEFDEKFIIDLVLKKFANYFGMVLDQIYNQR